MYSSGPGSLSNPLLLVFGVVIFGFGVWLFIKTLRLVQSGVHVKGTVIGNALRTKGRRYPRVRFTTATGIETQFTDSAGAAFTAYPVGREVPVIYDPDKPEHACIDSLFNLWLQPVICLAVGLLVVLVTLNSLPK